MTHSVKLCNNDAQDQWAGLYMAVAKALIEKYALEGKGVVREGVRRYAAALAEERKKALLDVGCKTNLETFFSDGFGFPCGDRCRKEWIRHTEQELFLNVAECPFANLWNETDSAMGRMFCEEFYPVLVHKGTSEKAQINLGMCLLSGRDNICRFSIYLRPANVSDEERPVCFPAFDINYTDGHHLPAWTPDFNSKEEKLVESFESAAQDKLGADCVNTVKEAVQSFFSKSK